MSTALDIWAAFDMPVEIKVCLRSDATCRRKLVSTSMAEAILLYFTLIRLHLDLGRKVPTACKHMNCMGMTIFLKMQIIRE